MAITVELTKERKQRLAEMLREASAQITANWTASTLDGVSAEDAATQLGHWLAYLPKLPAPKPAKEAAAKPAAKKQAAKAAPAKAAPAKAAEAEAPAKAEGASNVVPITKAKATAKSAAKPAAPVAGEQAPVGKPARATAKVHGRPETFMFFGSYDKPNHNEGNGQLVRARYGRTSVELHDAVTGEFVQAFGTAAKFWAAI